MIGNACFCLFQDDPIHRAVVRLFGDCPDASLAPMSIHNLVSIADEILGRQPGEVAPRPSFLDYLTHVP